MLAPMITLIAASQAEDAGVDEPHDHDGHGGARLDEARDERPGEHPFDRRSGDPGQQRPHPADGKVLNAVGHELESEHEDAEPADHRHEDVPEIVDLHV